MWIKIDNDKYWAKSVTKERGTYTDELIGWVQCTTGPCCTVPLNMHLHVGVQFAFINKEHDLWDIGRVFEDTIHIRDEITLMKVIDRLDNELALEKLEDL